MWTSCFVTMDWNMGGAGRRQYRGTNPPSWRRTRLQEHTCQLIKPEASRSNALLAKSRLARTYLPTDQARNFKIRCMRNLFIALDRPDVRYASKEINRAMAQPTINADETLKGLTRNYLTVSRLLWCYPRPCLPRSLDSVMKTGQPAP